MLDRLHEQASDRETRYIQAQNAGNAPITTPALTVRQVRDGFTFTPYEFRTFYVNGVCVQASMEITAPNNPADRFIVTCNAVEGWTVQCPRGRHEFGATVIAATQERIAQNRAARKAAN